MYTVEEYLHMIQLNLDKQTKEVVGTLADLKSITFAPEVKALFIESSLGDPKIILDLITREDMFNNVDEDEVKEGFAGNIKLTDEFLFDEWDKNDADIEFYIENDLEELSIAEIAGWVKECFDKAQGEQLPLPVYFNVHDDTTYVLDLKIGEWIEPEEVEL
ncbi:hypothetical protein QR721_06485 [Aciduricibacillus chroicocephali]|uniref:DUF2004 domain-containing protein n=1 Tax=Aciduricibacillus chroicocephali TaxID=3054939 RepID=A0ABY9KY99_9BACI|nr:hypothetical protein QR721_06485 [Bacillaceae bacterium 44XB]